jgi:H/ACA ribonucleoprotein complex subunit 4
MTEKKLPWELRQREVRTLKESKTNHSNGKFPEERSVEELLESGVICINKPEGPTSHLVSDYIQRILNVKKSGHGGTLDPHVTGVLPIGLNKATRITEYLLLAGKEYICLMHIHKSIERQKFFKTMREFEGKITQLPPIRSAVKRQNREREIYYIDILEINNQDVLMSVGCQAGTYIRKLVFDFGEKLGTGAHMQQLIRTKAGPFNDKEWYSLTDLKDAYQLYQEGNDSELKKIIKPIEYAIRHLGKVWVIDTAIDSICHGANLNAPGIHKIEILIKKNENIAVLTLKNELICIGTMLVDSDKIKERDIVVKTTKVFMNPETYNKKDLTD